MKRYLLLCISVIVILTVPYLHVSQSAITGTEGTAYRGDDPSRKQTKQAAPTDANRGAAAAVEQSRHGAVRKEILILNSYHPGYAWSDDEQAGIINVLNGEYKDNGAPVVEYLDRKRLPDGMHLGELRQLFRRKYQHKKFSVVIAMDNPALEFAIDNQLELFRNAPIVFCGINRYTPSLLKGRPDVTGIAEAIDITGTIEVMLRLHPTAREIFSSQDNTVTGRATRKELEALVPRFGARIRFRITEPLTMEELLKALERLPKDSLVLELGFITDKSGRTFNTSEIAKLVSEHSPVPVYSTYKQKLGFGIVGGKLLSPRTHGANCARIVLRVLTGEKASAIPVVFESDSQFMFDYKVMSRFGIPLTALPKGSTVINKPVSFYATHRGATQTALGIIGFLLIMTSLLMIIIIQKRRSIIALRESEKRYKDLYDLAPVGYHEYDAEGRITNVNQTDLDMLGYSRKEMIGQYIWKMNWEEVAREQVLAKMAGKLPPGTQLERTYIRKDGTLVPVLIEDRLITDKHGKIKGIRCTIQNITERKRMEDALRENEERYRNLITQAVDGICIMSVKGQLVEVNESFARMHGYSVQEMRDTSLRNLDTPETAQLAAERIRRIVAGEALTFEVAHYHKDGHVFPLEVSANLISAYGESYIQSFHHDITERKRAEEALWESEARYRQLVEYAPAAIYEADLTTGRLLSVNEILCEYSGYTRDELLAMNPLDLMTEESQQLILQRMAGYAAGEPVPPAVEYKARSKSGREFWISTHAKYFYQAGLPVRATVVAYDITERKRIEEALQVSREQLRALAGRLQAAREEERTLIARRIHDELGGALTGLKIDLSFLTRAALRIENEAVRRSLLEGMKSMITCIDEAIHSVRRIAMELRPGVLDDLGLIEALEWQLTDFEKRTGIRCTWTSSMNHIDLPADLSTALFRIFQETLTNVARHSGATEVRVRLRTDEDSSSLEVEDNGKGIEEKEALSSKALGFLGMRERAQMFGGRISVTGTPGRGTIITITIPSIEKGTGDQDQGGDTECSE